MMWTPEPWYIANNAPDGDTWHIFGTKNRYVTGLDSDLKADADRIVAAVNGCAGLNPKAYREVVELLKRFEEQNYQIKTIDVDDVKQALAHATRTEDAAHA